MGPSILYPVQVLREHITELEAAIAVCLADPDTRPVHKLRTETRRVQALLLLLAQVSGLPEHRKEAAALLRTLAKLRRAAGEVRDLDVHRKLLEDFAGAGAEVAKNVSAESHREGGGATGGEPPRRERRHRKPVAKAVAPAESAPVDAATFLRRAAAELRRHMGRAREQAAASLQETLGKRQSALSRAGETLMKVLQPAKDVPLPGPELLHDAEAVLTRDGLLGDRIAKLKRGQLHTVRKAAKAARYVAESLPGDAAAVQAARRFEALQEAGGQWHDAWQLARAARRRFGRRHELTGLYREERNRRLVLYRAALEAQAGETRPRPDRRPSRTARGAPRRMGATRKAVAARKLATA